MLSAILSEIRERYLDALSSSLNTFQDECSPSAPEVMLEIGRETAYAYRLYRVDMASNVNGEMKIQDVNPSTYLNFPPQSFEPLPGLALTLNPIAWNGVDFGINTVLSCDALETWALRWIDVDDVHPQDDRGFKSVIHSVTAPEASGDSTVFSVDFGSAPITAFEELLRLLVEAGATHVEMGSSCLG